MGSGFSSNPGGRKNKHGKALCSSTSNNGIQGLHMPAEATRNGCASSKQNPAKKTIDSFRQQQFPYEVCPISEIDNEDPTLISSDVSLHSLDSHQIFCSQEQYCKHVNMNESNHEEGGRSPSSTSHNTRPHKRSTVRTVTACTASTSNGKRISVYHSLAVTRGRTAAPPARLQPIYQKPKDPLAVFQRDLIDPYVPHPHPSLPSPLMAAPVDIIPAEGANQRSPRTTPLPGGHTDSCLLNRSRRGYSDGQGGTTATRTEQPHSGYQQGVNSPGLDGNMPGHSSTHRTDVYNRDGRYYRSSSAASQNSPSRYTAVSPPLEQPAQVVVVSGTSMVSHGVNRPTTLSPTSRTRSEGGGGADVAMEKSVACIVSRPQIMTGGVHARLPQTAVQVASTTTILPGSSASTYPQSVEMQHTIGLPADAYVQQQQDLLIQKLQQAGRKLADSISRQQGLPVEGGWQNGAANSLQLQRQPGRTSPLSFQAHMVAGSDQTPFQNAHLRENVSTPNALPGALNLQVNKPEVGGRQTINESQQKVIVFTRPQKARRSLATSQPVETAVPSQLLKQVGRIENSLGQEAVERNTEDGSEPVYESSGLWSPRQPSFGQNQYSQDPNGGQSERATGGTPSSVKPAGTGLSSTVSGPQRSVRFAPTASDIRQGLGTEYQTYAERGGFRTNQIPAMGSQGVQDQKIMAPSVAIQGQAPVHAGQPIDSPLPSRDNERLHAVSGPDTGTAQGIRASSAVNSQQTHRAGMSQEPQSPYAIHAQRQVQFPNAQVAGRTVAAGMPTQRAALTQPLHQASQRQNDIDERFNVTVDSSIDDQSMGPQEADNWVASPRQRLALKVPDAQLAHTSTAPPIQTEHAMLDQPPLNRVVQREGAVKQEAIETFREDDLDLQYQASYASSTGYEDEDGRLSPNAPARRRAAQRQEQQIADRPHGQVCNVEDDMEGYETLDEDDASKANHTVLVRLESYDELPSEISQHAQAKKFWGAEGSKGQRDIQQEGVCDHFANELPKMSTLPEETEGREFFYAPTAHSMPAREVLHRARYEKDVIAQRAKLSQVPILPMAAKNKREDVYMATTTVNQSPTSNAAFAQNRTDMNHLQEPARQTKKQIRSYHGDMMSGFAARQAADLKDPMSSFSSGGGGGGLGGRNASRRAKSCNPGDARNLNPRLFYASSQSLTQDPRSVREFQRQTNNFSPLRGMFKHSSEPNSCLDNYPRGRGRPKKQGRRRRVASTDGDRPESGGLKRRKWLRLFGVHKVGRPLDVSLKLYPAVISADGIAYKLEGPASEHVYHSPEPRLCDRKRYIQPCVYRPEDLRHTIYVFETAVLHQPMVFQGSFSRTELIRPPFEGPPPGLGGPQGGGGGGYGGGGGGGRGPSPHPIAGPSNAPTRNVKFLQTDQDSRTASQASTALLETRSGESVNNLLVKNNMQQSIQNCIPGLPPAAIDKAFRDVDPNQSLAGFMVYSTTGNGQVAAYDPKNPQCCCLVPLYVSKQSNRNAGNSIDITQYKAPFSPSILSSIGEDSVATQPEGYKELTPD